VSPSKRIVSLSGFLTEVLFDLGYGKDIIGVDITSMYPSATDSITKLGHISQLNVEALLNLQPDLVFVEEEQLKQSKALQQLNSTNIKVISITTSHSFYNAVDAARELKKTLTVSDTLIKSMEQKIKQDSVQLAKAVSTMSEKPRVLFIYARGAGRLLVGGRNTSTEAMIKLAGGINAIQSFDNFKPLTPEALIEAAPDAILMFSSGLQSLDGKKGLEEITGVSQTPAFQNDRIIAMNGHYLTSFGSRVGEAAIDLAKHLQK
jgi:iron complex transport system substrate-binding protein